MINGNELYAPHNSSFGIVDIYPAVQCDNESFHLCVRGSNGLPLTVMLRVEGRYTELDIVKQESMTMGELLVVRYD